MVVAAGRTGGCVGHMCLPALVVRTSLGWIDRTCHVGVAAGLSGLFCVSDGYYPSLQWREVGPYILMCVHGTPPSRGAWFLLPFVGACLAVHIA
jgi:hypothetical protein